jgi:hypothetical protein
MADEGMQVIDWVAIVGSGLILAGVCTLIARGRLKPRYALLWLGASLFLVTVSVWRGAIDAAGALMQIAYKPSLLFLAADVFLMMILLHMSVTVSELTDRVRDLAQELALLRGDRGAESGRDGD